jgi:hypothetical protein
VGTLGLASIGVIDSALRRAPATPRGALSLWPRGFQRESKNANSMGFRSFGGSDASASMIPSEASRPTTSKFLAARSCSTDDTVHSRSDLAVAERTVSMLFPLALRRRKPGSEPRSGSRHVSRTL